MSSIFKNNHNFFSFFRISKMFKPKWDYSKGSTEAKRSCESWLFCGLIVTANTDRQIHPKEICFFCATNWIKYQMKNKWIKLVICGYAAVVNRSLMLSPAVYRLECGKQIFCSDIVIFVAYPNCKSVPPYKKSDVVFRKGCPIYAHPQLVNYGSRPKIGSRKCFRWVTEFF